MSKSRHDDAIVRSFGVTFHSPQTVIYPVKGWDQLVHAADGVLSVHTDEGIWVLPPHRALWVPDGIAHRVQIHRAASLRSVYFRARRVRRLPRSCRVVNVSPLLRELILATVEHGALRASEPAQRRLAGVLLDQLTFVGDAPIQLPDPREPRSVQMAKVLRRNPWASLAAAAEESGASLRTMERLFQRDTGMSLGAWLRRLRLQLGLECLAGGGGVEAAAHAAGYNGASAFVSMFRRELGTTPGRYFQKPARFPNEKASPRGRPFI
jgi:AraC-like DNA-binding protein